MCIVYKPFNPPILTWILTWSSPASALASGGGADRQGGRGHLHLPGGRHHGDAAEGGEADGEGEGQREGGEGEGGQSRQLTG